MVFVLAHSDAGADGGPAGCVAVTRRANSRKRVRGASLGTAVAYCSSAAVTTTAWPHARLSSSILPERPAHYIDGKFVPSVSGATFPNMAPASDELLARPADRDQHSGREVRDAQHNVVVVFP